MFAMRATELCVMNFTQACRIFMICNFATLSCFLICMINFTRKLTVMYDVNLSHILQTGLYKQYCTYMYTENHYIQLKRYSTNILRIVISQLHRYNIYVLQIVRSKIETLLYKFSQLKFHNNFVNLMIFLPVCSVNSILNN